LIAYISTTDKVILWGQGGPDYFNDTWAYDPSANTWTNLPPTGNLPPPGMDYYPLPERRSCLETRIAVMILAGSGSMIPVPIRGPV
jgi:hypothetical protein